MVSVTLVEFLLARIAEDESAANEVATKAWSTGPYVGLEYYAELGLNEIDGPAYDVPDGGRLEAEPTFARPDAEHIARWDPARVLAECEAKRHIVLAARHLLFDDPLRRTEFWRGARDAVRADLCMMAQVWADHPQYQPEWTI